MGDPAITPETNLGASASQRPSKVVRGYVKNLFLEENGNPDYPDMITFPFRPPQINVDTSVNDETMDVMGMSHAYESYKNTTNATISFELYYNALMMIKEMSKPKESEGQKSQLNMMSEEIEKQRRFLQSLLYPGYSQSGVITAQQPPCILCLPGIVTVRAKLKSLGEIHEQSDIDGNIVALRLPVTFREAPMGRITMEDVLMNGMFRTWGL